MSSLKDTYPVKINSTSLFRPEKFDISSETIETNFQTEAGTDEVIVTRYGKVTISAEYACNSTWVGIFQGWANSGSALSVMYYDPLTAGYVTKSMRLRNLEISLVPHSDYLTGTMGVYTVSFDLIEF